MRINQALYYVLQSTLGGILFWGVCVCACACAQLLVEMKVGSFSICLINLKNKERKEMMVGLT